MAVRNSWSVGEVLTAGDLTDTFADKTNNKNLLYNGAMQVAQRGTSTAGITSSGYYTADRWLFQPSTMGTWTLSVESDGPTGSGLTKSLKMLCTTADAAPSSSGQVNIRQLLEGQNVQRIAKGTSLALQTTLSFWVKSNVTGTYIVEAFDADNSRQVSASYTISASATWEKKTITFPADTTGAFDNDNAASLILLWWLGAGTDFTSGTLNTTWASSTNANRAVGQTNVAAATNNYWQVTGVQLETGPVATGFEHKSFGVELAECQRYYYMHIPTNNANKTFATGLAESASIGTAHIKFATTMRTNPTLDAPTGTNYYSFYNGTNHYCTSLTMYGATQNSADVYNSALSGMTVADSVIVRTGSTAAYVGFSAEL